MDRNEFVDNLATMGLVGMARDGLLDGIIEAGSTTGDPRGQIKWKNAVGPTYTPEYVEDKDTLIIFNEPEVTINFGTQSPGSSDTAWFCMAVNQGGKLTLTGTIIAYAPHADKNVTIGVVRTNTQWVVSGTNIPEELS